MLLINGLPLINIEQKRTDKSLDEAFGQFMRYYREGEYCNNFMAFSQMMVITTEIETRYFATPKSIEAFNPAFVFHWANKENKSVNDWKKVIQHFLMIPMAHQMVGDYLVIDEAKEEENRRHVLMRPYQVYALQAVESAAFGRDNKEGIPHGGFVWHTTGSGKTITSFKTALFLATRAGFDKVVFLVDRRELDSRTSDNFKAYAAYEPVSVDDTTHSYQLKKQLKSQKTGIVVTTTFKLNALVKELDDAQDLSLADKKIVFIIDEAHRTTMGQMMGTIRSYFHKNGLFYGFTGTPLFDENTIKGKINEKNEVVDTTEKLFGPKLHQYTIDEAISDGNVLGFYVDYINTGEFKSYDDLRDKLIEKIKKEHPERAVRDIERQVQELSEALALTPKDFDFTHQTLSINKTWNYKGEGGFLPTKNKSSVRKIQIDWQTVIQFSELIKGLDKDEPIFAKEKKVYNSTVNDILSRYCLLANIPVISIHGLRHTHASLLLFAGVSIASVARRLGHASMTTTQKTYLHIIQELENKDIDLVMRSLSGLS